MAAPAAGLTEEQKIDLANALVIHMLVQQKVEFEGQTDNAFRDMAKAVGDDSYEGEYSAPRRAALRIFGVALGKNKDITLDELIANTMKKMRAPTPPNPQGEKRAAGEDQASPRPDKKARALDTDEELEWDEYHERVEKAAPKTYIEHERAVHCAMDTVELMEDRLRTIPPGKGYPALLCAVDDLLTQAKEIRDDAIRARDDAFLARAKLFAAQAVAPAGAGILPAAASAPGREPAGKWPERREE